MKGEEAAFFEGGNFPKLHCFVFGGTDERFAIAGKRQIQDGTIMAKLGVEERVGSFGGFGTDAPDADALIDTGGGEEGAVGTEGDGVLLLERLGESVATLAGGDVPKLDGAITAGGGEDLAVSAKGEGINAAVVARESAEFRAGFCGPEFYFLVVAARGESLTVGREREGVDGIGMAGDGAQEFSIGDIPDADFATDADIAAGRVNGFGIGREGGGVHIAAGTGEGTDERLRFGGVEFDFSAASDGKDVAVGRESEGVDGTAGLDFGNDFRNDDLLGDDCAFGGSGCTGIDP